MTTDCAGGVWTYSIELCRGLAPVGTQVILATMGAPPTAEHRAEVAALPHVQLVESNFKLEWMDDPWADIEAAGNWLLDLEKRHRPDIIHLNGYVHANLPWGAPVIVVSHSCVLSWWQAVKRGAAPSCWARYSTAVSGGLASADMVIAPSQAMLNEIARHYGKPALGHVIYNGRDASHFTSRRSKESMVLAVGRLWDEAKNISALAKTADRLPWQVWVVGDSISPSGKAIDLPNLKITGRCSPREVAKMLSMAAIYALPARYEPFGLSALEAALSACALVLGDIPSLREIWGDAATYVDPDDEQMLASAINRLIANPSERQAQARRALARAQLYSTGRMTSGYLTMYASQLARPSRTPRQLVTYP